MAGPSGLKLGGMIEGMGKNILQKEFFGSSTYNWVRLVDHRCLFYDMGIR